MLLADAGVEVVAFEARDRIGGRLWSVPSGDAFYEAGGEWIDADHERTLDLLEEFGLVPEISKQYPGIVRFQGEECREDAIWPDASADVERVFEAADFAMLDLDDVPWVNYTSFDLDQRSLASFVAEKALSARGRWWLEASLRSDEGEDLDRIGLLGWLCGQLQYLERDGGAMSAYRFPTGAQDFCERMLSASGVTPRLNMPLRRVEREFDQVHLYFEDHSDAFDRVILTIPPPAFRTIVFDPPLHESKEEALAQCGMSRTAKIAFRMRHPVAYRVFVDGPLQQLWDGTRPGGEPVWMAYVNGTEAERLAEAESPEELARAWFAAEFPLHAADVHDVKVMLWTKDPFAGGGFSYLRPGYVLNHMQDIRRPEGPIHFAGEHTATLVGFIEGALESAERAVEEIL